MGFSRYQIAIKKYVKPIAYRFRYTNSVTQLCNYMKQCIKDEVRLDVSEFNSAILDAALIKTSVELKLPVITETDRTAKILSITYGAPKVYSIDRIPENVKYVIYHWEIIKHSEAHHLIPVLSFLNNEKPIKKNNRVG